MTWKQTEQIRGSRMKKSRERKMQGEGVLRITHTSRMFLQKNGTSQNFNIAPVQSRWPSRSEFHTISFRDSPPPLCVCVCVCAHFQFSSQLMKSCSSWGSDPLAIYLQSKHVACLALARAIKLHLSFWGERPESANEKGKKERKIQISFPSHSLGVRTLQLSRQRAEREFDLE